MSNSIRQVSDKESSFQCQSCQMSLFCSSVSLANEHSICLGDVIEKTLVLGKGEFVCRQGQAFDSVYVLQTGSVKTFNMNDFGKEHITGFYHANDIVGFSGIDSGYYPISAKTLETTTICKVSFHKLEKLSTEIPYLKHQIFKIMSQQIVNNQRMLALLGSGSDIKVASFLLSLSARFNREDSPSDFFRLTMSRNDIGGYLGITVETVSRAFTKFQKENIIKIKGKDISIIDFPAMNSLIDGIKSTSLVKA